MARGEPTGGDVTSPTVTVCIPVHNGERFIAGALTNVLEQGIANLKLKVIDNASTDGTAAIVREFVNHRVELVSYAEKVEVGESWARALLHREGRYCLLLACDDRLTPGALGSLLEAAEEHSDAAAVFGRTGFASDGDARSSLARPSSVPLPGPISNLERYVLRYGYNSSLCGVLLRCDAPGLEIDPASGTACDLDLFLRLGRCGQSGYVVDAETVVVWEHGAAESENRLGMVKTALAVLTAHKAVSDVRPALYESRFARMVAWSLIELGSLRRHHQARDLMETVPGHVSYPWLLLLRLLSARPATGAPLLALREVRRRLRGTPVVR